MPKELIEILCLLAVLIFISVLMCIFNKDEDFSVREEDEIYNGYYDEWLKKPLILLESLSENSPASITSALVAER